MSGISEMMQKPPYWVFGAIAAYFTARMALAIALGFFIIFKTQWGRNRRILKKAYAPQQLRREFFANLRVILCDAVIVTLLFHFQWIYFSTHTWLATAFTFWTMLLWYEAWFYFTHRLFHTKAFYFIHAQHHIAQVPDPMSIISFSVPERIIGMTGILILPIMVSGFLPITFEGMTLYALFNLIYNWVGHLNVEVFPTRFAKSTLGKIIGTPTYHALHHSRLQGHYGLFTPALDRLFGTVFKDYPEIQEQAARGK